MAALLNLVHLRRHALPVHLMAGLDQEIDRRAMPSSRGTTGERPRLTAVWHVGTADRPVCAWHIDFAAPDFPSG